MRKIVIFILVLSGVSIVNAHPAHPDMKSRDELTAHNYRIWLAVSTACGDAEGVEEAYNISEFLFEGFFYRISSKRILRKGLDNEVRSFVKSGISCIDSEKYMMENRVPPELIPGT